MHGTTDRLNREYFRMFKEVPLMLRLRLAGGHGSRLAEVQRILIVNNGLIGEFIASLPAIRHLLDKIDAEVDLLVSPPLESLARGMRGISRVFCRPSVYLRDGGQQHGRPEGFNRYDLVFVLQLSGDSYRFLKEIAFSRIKLALAAYLKYGLYVAKRLKDKFNIKQLEEVLFEALEVQKTRQVEFAEVFDFSSEDYEKVAGFDFLRVGAEKNIVVHTGSGWQVKLWREERWVELLRTIHATGDFHFIFVGGGARENADFSAISRRLPFEAHSLVGRVNLRELALVMKHCHGFIGVDSGPRHIAHLLGLPSVCLLGPGPKIYSPRNRNAVFIDRSECRCTNLFCFRSERCMDRISVAEVVKEFAALMRIPLADRGCPHRP